MSYQPYVYKMTLSKDGKTRYYIGSRSSKRELVNPEEFLTESYNSSSDVIKQMLNDGWQCKREILYTFDGNKDGAIAAGLKETELLTAVDAKTNTLYVNDSNNGTKTGGA